MSDFPVLNKATDKQIKGFEISRMGIHWQELNEYLSLRGFLKNEIKNSLKKGTLVA